MGLIENWMPAILMVDHDFPIQLATISGIHWNTHFQTHPHHLVEQFPNT
jgi:hypothetical protein